MALSRRSTKMQNANAEATRWELHRTPWEILERQGSAFLLDMLKNKRRHFGALIAVGRREGPPWQRSEKFINAPGSPRARSEIVVQTLW